MTVITEANKTKARELTAQLTLDEKIAIVHAAGLFRNGNAERLGIPPLRMDDGPMGVRAELHNDNWPARSSSATRGSRRPIPMALSISRAGILPLATL